MQKIAPKGGETDRPAVSRVTRGVAPRWHDLNNRWAANNHYADRILALYLQMRDHTPD